MPNHGDSKYKTIKLLQLLYSETDEDHRLSYLQLAERLSAEGLEFERKSIKRDVEMLINDAGLDIEPSTNATRGAYVSGRTFELAELKLLADAVAASKFITDKKSEDLIEKLGTLTSKYHAKELKRQLVVTDRVKQENEKILYTLDTLYSAIGNDHAVSFQYQDWQPDKKMKLRHDGQVYTVSPAFLLFDNENYYLVAYSHSYKEIRFYRVDKIVKARELEEKAIGAKERQEIAKADLTQRTFGMFAGKEEIVSISCSASRVSNIFDRFGAGEEVGVRPMPENRVRVRVPVQVSGQFFGWLSGLGPDFVLEGPAEVKKEYLDFLDELRNNYE